MKTLYIYQGIQGSGKSTKARQFVLEDPDNRIRINRDDIRLMMGKPFNSKLENLVTKIEDAALTAAFKTGKDVVSDNMNLNSKFRRDLVKTAHRYGYSVVYRFVYTPLETCIERDANREHPVGEKVIRDTYEKYKTYIEAHNPENGAEEVDGVVEIREENKIKTRKKFLLFEDYVLHFKHRQS